MATRTRPRTTGSRAPEECNPSVLSERLDRPRAERLAGAFAALADPVRLRLLNLVAQAGEVCSCDLLAPLGKAQPTISHHTSVLADAGLIIGDKRGRWVWWRVVPEQLAALRSALDPARADGDTGQSVPSARVNDGAR
ncbi:MAG TPA: metalloregulator ArsR/SmtB family transcription factor [Acidimicrobiia bacterium]|nr:metalloregulator ArsR/SmtB family transcription factor [Acidimicrobiia bacterium]